jgi:hypothetical protein
MALRGDAAMLLWYDILPEAIEAHDEWHTREHFAERVGIPGFLRAQRWVAESGGPRYFVAYEVADLAVLCGAPYMDRLNHPTPWTRRTMPSFRGMTRGLCTVKQRHGTVLGASALTIRFASTAQDRQGLEDWLTATLPGLVQREGVTSAFLLEAGATPEMTKEQSIRGRDAGVDQVLWVTGYCSAAIGQLAAGELAIPTLEQHGAAPNATLDLYGLVCLADSD